MGPEVCLSLPLRYPQNCVDGPKEPGFYPMQGLVPCLERGRAGKWVALHCCQLRPNNCPVSSSVTLSLELSHKNPTKRQTFDFAFLNHSLVLQNNGGGN
jgi:hypothetical protein